MAEKMTESAVASALEGSNVTYEDLADMEKAFDDAETEIIRQQVALTAPLYEKREKLVSQIPNFWPLVLEQAPPDIDQFIQPSDSALLLSALKSLSVSHFEANTPDTGNPRSIAIKFEFTENDHFTNIVLEKKFWYRRARDGWTGLVSEPVRINWKEGEGKDLTGGLLDAVCDAWGSAKKANGEAAKGLNDKQKALAEKISGTGMGGLSFFAWFGFVGRKISEAESREASEAEKKRKKGEDVEGLTEEEEEQEDLEMSLEIFPDGDDLAVAFAEDVWPGAIKYFTQAQEQDALSDLDFESFAEGMDTDDDEEEEEEDDDDDAPPVKKQKK